MRTLNSLAVRMLEESRFAEPILWLERSEDNLEFIKTIGLDYRSSYYVTLEICLYSYQARTTLFSSRPFAGANIILEQSQRPTTHILYEGVQGFTGMVSLPGCFFNLAYDGYAPKKLYFRKAFQPPLPLDRQAASRLQRGDTLVHCTQTRNGRPIRMRITDVCIRGQRDVYINARSGNRTFTITTHTLYTVGIANSVQQQQTKGVTYEQN